MIRYNEQLSKNITKTVRNYNAKIRRLEKQNPALVLPKKITAKSLKEMSNTRQELNRNLAKLKRFSKRGAENNIILPSGEIVSNYELSEIEREISNLQRNLTRRINELAEITPKIAGIKQDYTYAEMGDMRLNNIIAKRNTIKSLKSRIRNGGNLKEIVEIVTSTKEKQRYQLSLFRENYMEKMFTFQAYSIGYDEEKLKEMKVKINKLNDKDFLRFFDTEKLFQMIRDKYLDYTKLSGDTYFSFEKEMFDIFDELYNNLDTYLKDYKSYK